MNGPVLNLLATRIHISSFSSSSAFDSFFFRGLASYVAMADSRHRAVDSADTTFSFGHLLLLLSLALHLKTKPGINFLLLRLSSLKGDARHPRRDTVSKTSALALSGKLKQVLHAHILASSHLIAPG